MSAGSRRSGSDPASSCSRPDGAPDLVAVQLPAGIRCAYVGSWVGRRRRTANLLVILTVVRGLGIRTASPAEHGERATERPLSSRSHSRSLELGRRWRLCSKLRNFAGFLFLCASMRPRSRRRPSLRMRLRWANSISTRFRVVARLLKAIAAQVPINAPHERLTRFPSGRA
jgi:hypothetical protein